MRLLGELLQSLKQTKKEGENPTVVLSNLLRSAQQSVLLVSQTNLAVLYRKRLSVLDGVMKNLSQASYVKRKIWTPSEIR